MANVVLKKIALFMAKAMIARYVDNFYLQCGLVVLCGLVIA